MRFSSGIPDVCKDDILVWSWPTRVFHWSLVGAVVIAWLTEDDWLLLHNWAGYLIVALLGFRLVWGLIGPKHARFADFVFRPGRVFAYLRSVREGRAKRHLGHNPAGGAMVVALLITLTLTALTGMAILALTKGQGPMADWGWLMTTDLPVASIEEFHELVANSVLILAFIHVGGVLMSSWLHRENLIQSMITGFKKPEPKK